MKHTTPARAALLSLFVLLAIVLVACGGVVATTSDSVSSKASKAVTIEGLKQQGVLTVGLRKMASVPLVVEQKGSMTGLDVELACALADELGLTATFKTVDDVEAALESTCDIVMSASADDKASYQVVCHYADTATAFFHMGKVGVVSVDDLSNKTVALEDGSSAQRSLLITNLTVQEATCATLSDAFESLEAGKADYVLCHTLTGAYLTLRHEGSAFAGTLSEPVENGIAVADNATEILSAVKKAFKRIRKNGALAKVRRSWLGDMPTLSKDSRIANIPLKETTGVSLEELSSGSELLSAKLDGSSAGANAVTLDGSRSRKSGSSSDADSAGSSNSASSSNSYDEDYDSDVSYASQHSQGASGAQGYGTQYEEESYGYQPNGQSYSNESYSNESYGGTYGDQYYHNQSYDDQSVADQSYDESQYAEPQYSEPQYSEPQYDEQYDNSASSYDYDSSGSYDSSSSYQDTDESASYEGYVSNYGDEYADYGTNNNVTE